jgi:hypothetical protein
MTATATNRCTHCNGALESVSPARGVPFKRCTSCGRDDRATFSFSPSGNGTASVPTSGLCKVDGCPGTVVAGRCACCEKRAKWAEEHTPKRACAICGGTISGKGFRKHCAACRPIAQKVQTAKSKAAQ